MLIKEAAGKDLAKFGCVVNLANTVLIASATWSSGTRSTVKNQRDIKALADSLEDALLNVRYIPW